MLYHEYNQLEIYIYYSIYWLIDIKVYWVMSIKDFNLLSLKIILIKTGKRNRRIYSLGVNKTVKDTTNTSYHTTRYT